MVIFPVPAPELKHLFCQQPLTLPWCPLTCSGRYFQKSWGGERAFCGLLTEHCLGSVVLLPHAWWQWSCLSWALDQHGYLESLAQGDIFITHKEITNIHTNVFLYTVYGKYCLCHRPVSPYNRLNNLSHLIKVVFPVEYWPITSTIGLLSKSASSKLGEWKCWKPYCFSMGSSLL